jgi:hypothetical protein
LAALGWLALVGCGAGAAAGLAVGVG